MQLVDMVRADMVRVLLGLLVLTAVSLAEPDEEANPDLKRIPQPTEKAEEAWESKPSEKRSDQYVDEYETTEERIELDDSPVDSQRHKPQLQDEYHEKQTIEYVDDAKAPQAYKFGYEIKDEKQGHQYRHEQKDAKGNVQGRFGYRDAKGQYREVDYVADHYGFRAKIKTNEAGITDEQPADVKIEKDKNEAVNDYPQHGDISRTVVPDGEYNHGKGAESAQYHHQPAKEAVRQGDESGYENQHQQSVNYESHSHHPYTAQEPHRNYHQSKGELPEKHEEGPAAVVRSYFVTEKDPHEHSPPKKQYQSNPDVIYQREQPRHHGPSPKEYHSNPDVIYQREQPRHHSTSPKEYQSNPDVIYQREQPRHHSPSPKEYHSNPEIVYEREHPQEHGPSPKEYRDSPETVYKREPIHDDYHNDPEIVYKPEHEQSPVPKYYHDVPETVYNERHSQNHKDKPHTKRPSTYQYEVDTNDHSYSYPKRHPSQAYQPPPSHAYNAYEKDYPANKYRQHIPDEHEVDLKEERHVIEDHEDYRNPIVDKNVEYQTKRVILPQTGEQNSHVYHGENQHHHAPDEHDYPVKERHVLKYDYEGENKLGYQELPKDAPRHVPVSHQYIRVIEVPQQQVSSSYEKEKIPYVHRPISHLRPESQPHSVVVLDPRNQVHPPQHELVYEERGHEHPRPDTYHVLQQNHPVQYDEKEEEQPPPKISHRESLRHAPKHDDQQNLQKAVLELNADVYKELLENKSPGRIVAVPINQLSNGHPDSSKSHLHPVSRKPHGVLHIPLDGKTQSTIDLKNLPLVLQIPGGKDVSYQKPQTQSLHQERVVEQDKLPIIYAHGSRSPTVSVPKSSGRLNKNKEYEKSKWIPMTPSWRNKLRRKSHEDDSPAAKHVPSQEPEIPRAALRLSDGGIYQILQTESSERLTNIRKKPSKSKATRRVSSRSRKLKAKQSARDSS
ncbi:hypothetical protein AVEN_185709-1 [Araneus ventricosus]|uniref:Cuticle protein 16.8 n=1 Tax=Araneus ventricosus TaxID=182803 RepID=A0A4Y2JHH5_ARAVE|nr:hypothetical protein AVEN_185709-1 [Araneus ventricosus]